MLLVCMKAFLIVKYYKVIGEDRYGFFQKTSKSHNSGNSSYIYSLDCRNNAFTGYDRIRGNIN